ncbi:Heat shock protein 12B [Sphaceloma murrayae]|uniref:Heat shock protein 12B n=1 Tax=Sphaceloma murrayae TaxID=2082308 RepID=A0A2K1R2Z8_9PEZI|nr:Heat shock protein 12B [Sphaceloma murrayae]
MSATRCPRIVVAYDFGTTYSGVAIVYGSDVKNPENIEILKSWPGSNGITSDKVPTVLDYNTEDQEPLWGYEVIPRTSALRCIKLLLDERLEFPEWTTKANKK